jgi:hypothetical protein
MARVRHLYEDTAVPVREIARLAGVTERTLYKYVAKGKWRRRYVVKPRGKAAAAGNRGRRWQRAAGHEGVKGAGGRFIARAEADKKVARGLKALDPRKRAQAEAACAAASARHDAARAQVERWQLMDVRCRAIERLNRRLGAYLRYRDKQAKLIEASHPGMAANIEAFHDAELKDSLRELQRLRGAAAAPASRPA